MRTQTPRKRAVVALLAIGAAVCVSGVAGVVAHSAVAARTAQQASTKITLKMTASPKTVKRGQTVTFKLSLTNTGSSPAIRVKVCDQMPAVLTPLPAFRFRIKGNQLCGIIQRLPISGTVVMTLKGTVSPSANASLITNRATAKGLNTNRVSASAQAGIITPCGGLC